MTTLLRNIFQAVLHEKVNRSLEYVYIYIANKYKRRILAMERSKTEHMPKAFNDSTQEKI